MSKHTPAMRHFGEDWDYNEVPLAYLITIRTYASWLHGDDRFSVDTHDRLNVFGAPRRVKKEGLRVCMENNMTYARFTMDKDQREAVRKAIREVCEYRNYKLQAINVRSNHLHAVVSGDVRPERVANAFKSYATRELRRVKLIGWNQRPWARGRSRKYLWKECDVTAAIDYVLYCQGDFTFEEWLENQAS